MFKLAHISDLHLAPIKNVQIHELLSKRIIGYINWQFHRKNSHQTMTLNNIMSEIKNLNIDHLAITGDLVNLATRTEIIEAQKWLSKNCPVKTTSLVPGNHDAYIPGALKKIITSWQPWIKGDLKQSKHYFPYMKIRGPLAIIGLSTANATMPFRATGYFTENQAKIAQKLLQKAKKQNLYRVILIHHPPYYGATHSRKQMLGIRNFHQMLMPSGAELILHGHTHLNTHHDLDLGFTRIPTIGISSASQVAGGKKPIAGFNLFHISNENGMMHCIHHRYLLDPLTGAAKLIKETSLC